MNTDLIYRLREFIEMEGKSCLIDPSVITPEYIFRMCGGPVALSEIEKAMKTLRNN